MSDNCGCTIKLKVKDNIVRVVAPDDNKLDKVTNVTELEQVYAKTASGEQTMLNVDKQAVGNALVQRQENSQVTVPETPEADTDATSKKYVDEKLGGTTIYRNVIKFGEDDFDYNSIIIYSNKQRSISVGDSPHEQIAILIDDGENYIPVIRTEASVEYDDYYGEYLVCDFYYYEGETLTSIHYNELYGVYEDEVSPENYYPDSWKERDSTKL